MQNSLPKLLIRFANYLRDISIYWSFDQSGFRAHQRLFNPQDLDVDMAGKVCLITGANSGIGYSTSFELAKRGAQVHLLCRNEQRGKDALKQIQNDLDHPDVRLDLIDMSKMESIRTFIDRFSEHQVDVLIHNAGVLPDKKIMTDEGLETVFATHIAGPLMLTSGLVEKLKEAEQGRILFVSSGGMYTQKLNLEKLQGTQDPYDGVNSYAQTKRAQVVLTEILAEKLTDTNITVNCMHPGWAETPAVKNSLPGFYEKMKKRLRTPREGADTLIWLAVHRDLSNRSGKFWFDRELRKTHFLPWTRENRQDRKGLWELCKPYWLK